MNIASYPSALLYVPPESSYCIHQLWNINVVSDHADKDTVPLKLTAWGAEEMEKERETCRKMNTVLQFSRASKMWRSTNRLRRWCQCRGLEVFSAARCWFSPAPASSCSHPLLQPEARTWTSTYLSQTHVWILQSTMKKCSRQIPILLKRMASKNLIWNTSGFLCLLKWWLFVIQTEMSAP